MINTEVMNKYFFQNDDSSKFDFTYGKIEEGQASPGQVYRYLDAGRKHI